MDVQEKLGLCPECGEPINATTKECWHCKNQKKTEEIEDRLIMEIKHYLDDCRGPPKCPVDSMRVVGIIAHHLVSQTNFLTFQDTGEIFIYRPEDGIYKKGGEQYVRKFIQRIVDIGDFHKFSSTHNCNEVVDMVRRLTMVGREDAKEPENLIALANGVLNIDSGEFLPFSPKYRFLAKLAVAYNKDALCPEIEKFISMVMPSENMNLFYELIGATLLRANPWQKGAVFVGEGINGKSTAVSLISKLLGAENTTSVGLQELEENRFAPAGLFEKHANLVADMSALDLKGTSHFKAALGGDMIRGEHKNGQPFFFVNYAKFIVSCNKLPKTPDDTMAFYRRWIILVFPNCFEGKEDRQLLARLTTPQELSGLLNKALPALKAARERGNFTYDLNSAAIRSLYVHLSDSATAFCEDMLESGEDDLGLTKEEVWNGYLRFVKERRLVKVSEKGFWQTLPGIFSIYEFRPSSDQDPERKRRVRGLKWKVLDQQDRLVQHSPISTSRSMKIGEREVGSENSEKLDLTDFADSQNEPPKDSADSPNSS